MSLRSGFGSKSETQKGNTGQRTCVLTAAQLERAGFVGKEMRPWSVFSCAEAKPRKSIGPSTSPATAVGLYASPVHVSMPHFHNISLRRKQREPVTADSVITLHPVYPEKRRGNTVKVLL